MSQKPYNIHLIFTGGTIDSAWEGTKDTAVPLAHSAIPKYLASLQLYAEFKFTEICMKDSRSLTARDLKKIVDTVNKSKFKHIIITHGTYTMVDTARFLKKHIKKSDKIIVLTGSMTPLVGFLNSDAPYNLGFAIGQSIVLKPGVYISINGMNFKAEEAAKNINMGRFFSILQAP